jgi:hypothetical protein
VIDNDAVLGVSGVSAAGSKAFQWTNQVAAGYEELYFKGCIHGASAIIGPTGLSGNIAVGKVNYSIQQGFNAVSVPFAQTTGGNTLTAVFGNQLDGGTSDTADQVLWKNSPTSWGMEAAYLSNGTVGLAGQWYKANQPTVVTEIPVNAENGYLVAHLAATTKPITLIGKVLPSATIYISNGFNLIGTVFPTTKTLNSLNLHGVENVKSGNSDSADQIMLKNSSSSWGMKAAYLSDGSYGTTAGQWYLASSPTTPVDFDFYMKYGYFYVMKNTGVQIVWPRTFP